MRGVVEVRGGRRRARLRGGAAVSARPGRSPTRRLHVAVLQVQERREYRG